MLTISCMKPPAPLLPTPTKLSHPTLDVSSPLSNGMLTQYDVWEFLKEEPKEAEVFGILGLPDSVWVADSRKYKVLNYFIESLDDFNSVEIDINSKKVNSFEWD